MLGKQNPYMEQSWIIHDYHNLHEPYEFVLQVPQSVQMLPAGCHVYRRKVCGVRCLLGNFMKLLYGNKCLSIVSATKLAKKYQLNFDLVLLFLWAFSSSKTWPARHPECTDRSCNKALTVRNQELPVSNVTPMSHDISGNSTNWSSVASNHPISHESKKQQIKQAILNWTYCEISRWLDVCQLLGLTQVWLDFGCFSDDSALMDDHV